MSWDLLHAWAPIVISVVALALSIITILTTRKWRPRPLIQVELDRTDDGDGRSAMPYREILIANRGNAPVHDFRVTVSWGFGELFGDGSDVGTLGADEVVQVMVGHVLPYFENLAYEHSVDLSVNPDHLDDAEVVATWRQPPNFKRVAVMQLKATRS